MNIAHSFAISTPRDTARKAERKCTRIHSAVNPDVAPCIGDITHERRHRVCINVQAAAKAPSTEPLLVNVFPLKKNEEPEEFSVPLLVMLP